MNVFSFALRKRDKRRKKLGKRRRKGRKVKENSLTVGDPLGVRVRRERKVSHLTLHVDGGAALVDLDEALGLAAVGRWSRAVSRFNASYVLVVVTRVAGDMVTVDGNHPLAGQALHFAVEITEVRTATEEELAHGHVHGPGGHHH